MNGRAPVVRTGVADAPAVTLARLAELKEQPTEPVAAPLYDGPMVALPWMALGVDGAAGDGVPQFFRDRGVNLAKPADPENPQDGGPAPAGNRLLRKCEVVLHQPRAALAVNVQTGDGLATGQATTTVTLILRPIDPGDALRVYGISQWAPAQGPQSGGAGDSVEPNYDEMVIGTVYLLSPPDAAPHSDPDPTWEPYVRHGLFWNLAYAQPAFRPVATEIGDPLLVPLAAGAGQAIINEFTSLIGDAANLALEFLTAQSMQGTFWAPTGGGSDAHFPEAPAAAAKGAAGLDKDGRLEAQRAQEQAAILSEQLDPSFPYAAPAFNLALLTP